MKHTLLAIAALVFGAILFLAPVSVQSAPLFGDICDKNTTDSTVCQDKDKPQGPKSNFFYGKNGVITKVVRLIALAVGVASVIMIMVGGIKFTMASGDPGNVKSAKDTVVFALVGLIIALIAGSIIQFVLNKL